VGSGRGALVVLGLLVVLGGARGSVASGTDVHGFRPPHDPFGYAGLAGVNVLEAGEVFTAATLSLAERPFATKVRGGRPVRRLHTADLRLGVGVLRLWRGGGVSVGASLPYALHERGDGLFGEGVSESGLGSLRTDAKIKLQDPLDDAIGVALRFGVDWPTGDADDLLAEDGLAATGAFTLEWNASVLRIAGEVGYRWIEGDGRLNGRELIVSDQVTLGMGFAVAPLLDLAGYEHVEIFSEARHAFRAADPYRRSEESPLEVGGGLRFRGDTLLIVVSGFAGLNRGVSAAQRRFALEVGVRF
jgi:hypothetical protein